MPVNSLLPIGKIRKSHGIRGEVSVDYYADSPDLLRAGVYLQYPGKNPVFLDVVSFRAHHGALLVHLKTIDDRNAADTLRGFEILIPEDRLPEPDDGSIYLHEIMGLRVLAVDNAGKEDVWGTISDVADIVGQELWTISDEKKNDILFPATPELILGFDLEARIVRIAPPPGLIDLYRPSE